MAEPLQPGGHRAGPIWLAAKLLLFALILFFVGRSLAQRLGEGAWRSLHPNLGLLAAAGAVQCATIVLGALPCRLLLQGFGVAPSFGATLAVLTVSSLGKYVPGKLLSATSAVWMFHARGVPPAAGAAALLLAHAQVVLTGLLLSVPLLGRAGLMPSSSLAGTLALCAAAVGVLALLHPRLLTVAANRGLRLVRRPPLPTSAGSRAYLAILVVLFAGWLLGGLALWLCGRAVAPWPADRLALCVSASAFSSVAGLLAVFAPAGLGVREGLLLLVLSPPLGPAQAAAVAVLSRLVRMVAELIAAGAGAGLLRRARMQAQ
jgi:hypothetical protein